MLRHFPYESEKNENEMESGGKFGYLARTYAHSDKHTHM